MDGSSWLPSIMGHNANSSGLTLQEVCVRISCGVATGADDVFVRDADALPASLRRYAYPSIAGREMGDFNDALDSRKLILVPYNLDGILFSEDKLGKLGDYLSQPAIRSQLVRRTCVRRKPWYAFHETPPLNDILRPNILCKDITERPKFWVDRRGKLVRDTRSTTLSRRLSRHRRSMRLFEFQIRQRMAGVSLPAGRQRFSEAAESCPQAASYTFQILRSAESDSKPSLVPTAERGYANEGTRVRR